MQKKVKFCAFRMGYAFELLCSNQIELIKKALGISGVSTSTYCWQNTEAQIDLLLYQKTEKHLNIIECKFYEDSLFVLDKEAENNIVKKISSFNEFKVEAKIDNKIRSQSLIFVSLNGIKEVKSGKLDYKETIFNELI